MDKIMLKGVTIQLLPYDPSYWESLAYWFYNEDYKDMFRQFTKMLTEEEFKQYPRVIMGEVFIIRSIESSEVLGMVQCIPGMKKNKACYIGFVLDKKYHNKHIPTEAMIIFMDYLFNRQGYNKIILEMLESNDSLRRALDITGFYREGKMIQECFLDGRFQNELRYSMTAKYFNKNKDKVMDDYKQFITKEPK